MLIEDLFRAPWHERMKGVIQDMIDGTATDTEVLAMEIEEWQSSDRRLNMITGEQYYLNKTAIEIKEKDFDWETNTKLSHGFAKKLVDQKIGYLLSKEPTFASEDENYGDLVDEIFSRGLLKKIKNVGKEAINKGIAYLYPYINERGELAFTKFPSEQIIPYWADNEHLEVLSFVRVFPVTSYEGKTKKTKTKVEFYHESGIEFYELEGSKLIPDVMVEDSKKFHFTLNGEASNWERIPLIHFKYNEEEQPLIDSIKSLVDNYNLQASTNADLLADIPKFIYILTKYGGESDELGDFLDKLKRFRVLLLDEGGAFDKLQADINTEAVESEVERGRNSIYEFGRGVDTKGDDLQTASGVALKHRYGDLDMDCNILEAEFHASIQHMLWFVDIYLNMTGKGDFTEVEVDVTFNRDIIIAETEAVENCEKSVGILDDQTIRENHPWYSSLVEDRLKKQEAEQRKEIEGYRDTFPPKDVNADAKVD